MIAGARTRLPGRGRGGLTELLEAGHVRARLVLWGALAASLLFGAVAATSLKGGVLLAVFVIAGASVFVVARYPRLALIGAAGTMAVLPLDGLPFGGAVHPAVLLLGLLAVLSITGVVYPHRATFSLIDAGAVLVFGGMVLSFLAGQQTPKTVIAIGLVWGLPFLAGRALGAARQERAVLWTLVIAGTVALPFGALELAGHSVLVDAFSYATSVSRGVGVADTRLGLVRTQGGWEHPILYAIFLSGAAIAAAGLWMSRVGRRWPLLVLALAFVGLQATTLTRTGWLMLVIAAAMLLAISWRQVTQGRNVAITALAALAVVAVLAIPQTRQLLLGQASGKDASNIAYSDNYRAELNREALTPGFIQPFGTSKTLVGPGGRTSVDNQYLLEAWSWGFIPLAGFVVIAVGYLPRALRMRRDIAALSICAIGLGMMVAVYSVALFSQLQVVFWLVAGTASGLLPRSEVPDSD
ncbi:MAG: hypothetical protein AAGC46_04045 [Solirubrobacteraceae bacterium]|nr:hypothetical protein [Patulibacter sp.]